MTRRSFLQTAVAAALPASLPQGHGFSFLPEDEGQGAAPAAPPTREKAPFPYVDGLSFMGSPADLAASGLAAFISDVSSGEQLKTTDGSIKFFRSFEACARSMTAMRRRLNSGAIEGAFLATKGSQIKEAHQSGRMAVFFQFQGAEPIGEDLTRLDLFYELGLRVLQITHHNNNPWGGGAIERTWSGITKKGIEGVERLNALGIIPDLSHVSDPTSLDVLKASKKPVIVSHGGARALVNNARCTGDEVIKGVAQSGGAMGVFMMSFWLTSEAVPTAESYVNQIRHIVKIGGIDAAAIANDYPVGGEQAAIKAGNDNAKIISNFYPWWDSVAKEGVLGFDKRPTHVVIPELNHPRRMFSIHQALDKAGFKTGEIEKIMGGNWIRVLTDSLG
jgi:membrane dipeptidase